MELLQLDSPQVAQYEERGFQLLLPLQQVIYEILFETEQAPDFNLTWTQIRGCVYYILETASGRRERVRII